MDAGTTRVREEKILVIDDQSANLAILKHILSNAGFEPTLSTGAAAGLEAIAQSTPDLILLDIMMPGMDGFEVCQVLKSQSATRRIPILLISGLSETEAKTKGLGIGASDYITKPFESAEVLARIETHLRIGRLEAKLRHSESVMKCAERISHIGTWTCDLRTGAIEWSDSMFELFGESADGTSFTVHEIVERAVPKDDRSAAEAMLLLSNGLTPETRTEQFRRIDPEGRERILLATRSKPEPSLLGDDHLVIGTLQDITEIRHPGIREAEKIDRHSRILKSLPVGFVLMDPGYAIREVNAAFQHITGYSEEELIGSRLAMLDLPESGGDLESCIFQAFISGVGRVRSCFRHKDGRTVPFEAVVGSDEQAGSTIYVCLKDVGPSPMPNGERRGE